MESDIQSKSETTQLHISQNMVQEMAQWVGAQVELAKNKKTSPHYDVTPRNSKPKHWGRVCSVTLH